jgi:hypothetical protein
VQRIANALGRRLEVVPGAGEVYRDQRSSEG